MKGGQFFELEYHTTSHGCAVIRIRRFRYLSDVEEFLDTFRAALVSWKLYKSDGEAETLIDEEAR
jgi:hypothetical protein